MTIASPQGPTPARAAIAEPGKPAPARSVGPLRALLPFLRPYRGRIALDQDEADAARPFAAGSSRIATDPRLRPVST